MAAKTVTSEVSEESSEIFVKTELPQSLYRGITLRPCNLQNVCRSCLSVNNKTLFSLIEDKHSLSDIFFKITSIQVNGEDVLPSSVCGTCHQELLRCVNFKMKCLNSNHVLKTIVEGNLHNFNEESYDTDSKDDLEIKLKETDSKVRIGEVTEFNQNILDSFHDTMSSDDETLCIVQENIKKINRKSKNVLEMDLEDADSKVEKMTENDENYLESLCAAMSSDDEANLLIVEESRNSTKNKYKNLLSSKGQKQRKQYVCSHCPKKYSRNKGLRDHIQKCHSERKAEHSCVHCSASFPCGEDLQVHQSLHNKDFSWKCNQCHKEFNVRAALRRHLQRHMSWKRHSCDVCGKRFIEHYAMLRHRAVHGGLRPERKHKCLLCDKRFIGRRELETHSATHSRGAGEGEGAGGGVAAPHPCPACDKRFASRRLLASHRRVHTDDKPYACIYCDKRFRHESARTTHHRTHTGERPYVCSVCGKTFIQHSNLNMHMRSHTGERPYSCSKCNSKFSTGSALKNHQLTHTGERPYSCNVCGKRFARGSMSAHMRLHTGERPFPCAVCPRRFNNAAHLREHNRLHTGERPFECAMCTQKFATKSHLIKHVRVHEKKKPKGGVMFRPYQVTTDNGPTNIAVDLHEGIHDPPMVAQELTLPNEQDTDKTEVIVLNNHLPEGFIVDDMNLLAVNEGEVSISATSAVVEGTVVKLYQLDQSLLQIHRTPGQLTISKITSKMTANF